MDESLIQGGCMCDGGSITSLRGSLTNNHRKSFPDNVHKSLTKDIQFEFPDKSHASMRKVVPDGKQKGFKADKVAQYEVLNRIGKGINRLTGKETFKSKKIKDDKEFKTRTKQIASMLRRTGGALADDYLNAKMSISTRSSNLREILTVLKEIINQFSVPGVTNNSEFKSFRELLRDVLAHATDELNILDKSMDITSTASTDIDKIIAKNKKLEETLLKFQIQPGSIGTGKLLASYLRHLIGISELAKMVNTYLKQLGITLKEYDQLSTADLQKRALHLTSESKDLEQMAKGIGMINYIVSLDSKKKDIVNELKKGGDVPPSYEKRVKEEDKMRKDVLAAFSAQFSKMIQELWIHMDKFSRCIGTDVEVNDSLIEFARSYAQISELEQPGNLKAILGYTTDAKSKAIKDSYIKRIDDVISRIKEIKAKGDAKDHLDYVEKLLKEYLEMVETYNKNVSGGAYTEGMVNFSSFEQSREALNYFIDIGKMKQSMERSFIELNDNLKDFDNIMKKALDLKTAEIRKDKEKALDSFKSVDLKRQSDNISLGPEIQSTIKSEATKYVEWAYDLKSKMWLVAQAMEIYLKEFNLVSLKEYEEFIQLREILDPIKIIKDGTGEDIIKIFEPQFTGDDYYAHLKSIEGGSSGISTQVAPILTVDKDFKWDDRKELIVKARTSFNVLKNIISVFMGIGDRIGKENLIQLRRKTSLSITQMWEYLGEFLFGAVQVMWFVGELSNYVYKTDLPLFSHNIGVLGAATLASKVTLGKGDPTKVDLATGILKNYPDNQPFYFTLDTTGWLMEGIKYSGFYEYHSHTVPHEIRINRNQTTSSTEVSPFNDTIPGDSTVRNANIHTAFNTLTTYISAFPLGTFTPKLAEILINYNNLAVGEVNGYMWNNGTNTNIRNVVGTSTGADTTALITSTLVANQAGPTAITLANLGANILATSLLVNSIKLAEGNITSLQTIPASYSNQTQFDGDLKLLQDIPSTYACKSLATRIINETINPIIPNIKNPTGLYAFDAINANANRAGLLAAFTALQIPIVNHADYNYSVAMLGVLRNIKAIIDANVGPLGAIQGYKDLLDPFIAVAIAATNPGDNDLRGKVMMGAYEANIYPTLIPQPWNHPDNNQMYPGTGNTILFINDVGVTAENIGGFAPGGKNFVSFHNGTRLTTMFLSDTRMTGVLNGTDLRVGGGNNYKTGSAGTLALLKANRNAWIAHPITPGANPINALLFDQAITTIKPTLISNNHPSLIINIPRKEKTNKIKDGGGIFKLYRDSYNPSKEDPANQSAYHQLVDFTPEHEIFKSVIKAALAKVNSSIGIFEMFNVPGRINIFSRERIILGGSYETIQEAIPLYIRLPLFVDAYKYIFMDRTDLRKEEFTPKQDIAITFLPEMRGTVYEGLFNILWRDINDNDFYSENDCMKIIAECNRIYNKFKGDNVAHRVITDLVKEVNSRYGKMKNTEIKAFNKYVKDENEFDTTREDQILPGEGEPDFPGALPISHMGLTSTNSNDDFYKIDHTKRIIYDFMTKISSFLGQLDKDIKKSSFDAYVQSIENQYMNAKDDRTKLEITIKGMRGVSHGMVDDEIVSLLIHEFVKTPLSILYALYQNMKPILEQGCKMEFGKVWDQMYNILSKKDVTPNKLKDLIVDLMTKKYIGSPFNSTNQINVGMLGNYPTTDNESIFVTRDPTSKVYLDQRFTGHPISPGDTWKIILEKNDAIGGGDAGNNYQDWMNIIDWGESYGVLVDLCSSLTDGELITIKKEASKISLDWSELRSQVESTLEYTRRIMEVLRKFAPDAIHKLEKFEEEGSYFWLKDKLYDKFIMGKGDDNKVSLEIIRSNLKDAYVKLNNKKYKDYLTSEESHIDFSSAIIKRVVLSTNSEIKSGFKSSVSKHIENLESKVKDYDEAKHEYLKGDRIKHGFINESFNPSNCLVVEFNDILEHYLKDIYDWASEKTYSRLLQSLASGSLNQEIGEHERLSIRNIGQNFNLQTFTESETSFMPGHLNITVAYLIHRLLHSMDKGGSKKYTFTEYNQLPDPYKEKLKCYLPQYKKSLQLLVNKASILEDTMLTECDIKTATPSMRQFKKMWAYEFKNVSLIPMAADPENNLFASNAKADTHGITLNDSLWSDVLSAAFGEKLEEGVDLITLGNWNDSELMKKIRLRDVNGKIVSLGNGTKAVAGKSATLSAAIIDQAASASPAPIAEIQAAIQAAKDNAIDTKYFVSLNNGGNVLHLYPTQNYIKLVNDNRKQLAAFAKELGYSLSDKYNYRSKSSLLEMLTSHINIIKSNALSLISDINVVLKELDDVPIHGQLYPTFIESYKEANRKDPFMPLSMTTWFLSHPQRFFDLGSDEHKIAFATRGIRGAFNLNKLDMDYFKSSSDLYQDYENVYKSKFGNKDLLTMITSSSVLMKYYYYLSINRSFSGLEPELLNAKSQLTFTKEITDDSRKVVNMVESPKIEDEKTRLIQETARTHDTKVNSILINIHDLNINPVNVHALYRQVPFTGLYTYAFNGDAMILDALSITLHQDTFHDFNINRWPLEPNGDAWKNHLLMLLSNTEFKDDGDFYKTRGLLAQLESDAKDGLKKYTMKYTKDILTKRMMLMSESKPFSDDIAMGSPIPVLALGASRSAANYNIIRPKFAGADAQIRTDTMRLVNNQGDPVADPVAATNALNVIKEGLSRFNMNMTQEMFILDLLLEVCKKNLLDKLVNMGKDINPDSKILQSTGILIDYIK